MFDAIRRNGLILALFACVSTGMVAFVNALTKDRIQQQQDQQLSSILQQVIPADYHDNNLTQSCILVTDPRLGSSQPMTAYLASLNGQPSAIAIETIAPDGYSGAIKVIAGMDYANTLLGVRVLAHQETPGLGDKMDLRISDWVLSFDNKSLTADNQSQWAVRKDGGQFDQFTGATITPRAIVKAVKQAMLFVNEQHESFLAQPLPCQGDAK